MCVRLGLGFGFGGVGVKVKGKFLPITGHEGPEGEQMYSSTLPSTSALDGGRWSTPRPGRFTSVKCPVPIVGVRVLGVIICRVFHDFRA